MESINVFIDTSSLPREPSKFDNPLIHRLSELSKSGVLKIYVSDVVFQELKTQLQEKIEDDIKKAIESTKQIEKNPWLDKILDKNTLTKMGESLTKAIPEIQKTVEKKIRAMLNDMSADVLPVKENHGIRVLNDYFIGKPPFKNIKSREDFPDAFIYQCVKDFVENDNHSIHCIVKDNNLGSSLVALKHVIVHKTIYDFIKSKELEEITKKLEDELRWEKVYATLKPTLQSLYDDIKDILEAHLPDEVSYKYVSHYEIPSDNNDALINGIYERNDLEINWNEADNIGPGFISIPFTLTCDSDLEFPVYHSNAYTVPKGVHVSYRDHEEDTFFDASGNVILKIDGIMILEFETKESLNELPELLDLQIEEIRISIVENNDGSIF